MNKGKKKAGDGGHDPSNAPTLVPKYHAGSVLSAVFHHERFPKTPDDPRIRDWTKTTTDNYIFSKKRRLVILACFKTTFLAVPMYSRSGSGPSNMDDVAAIIPIRDSEMANKSGQPPETVWVRRNTSISNSHTSNNSFLNIPEMGFLDYNTDSTFMGSLDDDSMDRFIHRVQSIIGGGFRERPQWLTSTSAAGGSKSKKRASREPSSEGPPAASSPGERKLASPQKYQRGSDGRLARFEEE